MKQKVVKVWREIKIFYRARLACGHVYIVPIPESAGVLTEYDCKTCEQLAGKGTGRPRTKPRTRATREAQEPK